MRNSRSLGKGWRGLDSKEDDPDTNKEMDGTSPLWQLRKIN
jgi:hypothetical protein